jgi:hypothetical protein
MGALRGKFYYLRPFLIFDLFLSRINGKRKIFIKYFASKLNEHLRKYKPYFPQLTFEFLRADV